jgi:tRNA-dihydrouridine synthase C
LAETDEIDRNAAMAEEGGADWLTLHARTRIQGYAPPVFWPKVGEIVRRARVPVVVNGDIWTVEDFRRCQEESGSVHFMIGRPALANPRLSHHISRKLGLTQADAPNQSWRERFAQLIGPTETEGALPDGRALARIKQWAAIAHRHGSFPEWPTLKHATSLDQIWDALPREAEEMAYAN